MGEEVLALSAWRSARWKHWVEVCYVSMAEVHGDTLVAGNALADVKVEDVRSSCPNYPVVLDVRALQRQSDECELHRLTLALGSFHG